VFPVLDVDIYLEVASTRVVIDTNSDCNYVKPIEPTIAIAVEFDNMLVRFLDKYG